MKLVSQTDILGKTFSEPEAIDILAANGFDGMDMSFFQMTNGDTVWCTDAWKEYTQNLRAQADALGITFEQAHAPFPSNNGDPVYDKEIREKILRAMEAASILGVPYIVVHPLQHVCYMKNRQMLFDMNVEFYKSLIPYCEKWNIKVCAENMWQMDENRHVITDSILARASEFNALLDTIDSPWIVGCLDLGHVALIGEDPADMIRAMGTEHIKCFHIHDVDYVNDCHTLPFTRKLDWEAITKAIADIGFEGNFTFESDEFLRPMPKELQPQANKLMEQVGRYLIGRVEYYKSIKE